MSVEKEVEIEKEEKSVDIVDLVVDRSNQKQITNRIIRVNGNRVGKKVIVNENLIFISDGEYVLSLSNESDDFDKYLNLIREFGFDLKKFFDYVNDINGSKRKFRDKMICFFDERDGKFFYKNIELGFNVLNLFSFFYKNELDFTPILNFLENCSENPSDVSIDEFFLFFKTWNLPITHDGHILAFKAVNNDYTSIHDKVTKNDVGTWVEMDRSLVDANRNVECSTGLHFCSFGYLRQLYSRKKIVIVKVNPRDIVSVPRDYNNMKVRCCRYYILCDYNHEYDYLSNSFYKNIDGPQDIISKEVGDCSSLNKVTEKYCRHSVIKEIKDKFSNT